MLCCACCVRPAPCSTNGSTMLRRTPLAFYNIRHAAETDETYLYNRLALSLRCNFAVGTACAGSSKHTGQDI